MAELSENTGAPGDALSIALEGEEDARICFLLLWRAATCCSAWRRNETVAIPQNCSALIHCAKPPVTYTACTGRPILDKQQ